MTGNNRDEGDTVSPLPDTSPTLEKGCFSTPFHRHAHRVDRVDRAHRKGGLPWQFTRVE
jgi:hypothetical protein